MPINSRLTIWNNLLPWTAKSSQLKVFFILLIKIETEIRGVGFSMIILLLTLQRKVLLGRYRLFLEDNIQYISIYYFFLVLFWDPGQNCKGLQKHFFQKQKKKSVYKRRKSSQEENICALRLIKLVANAKRMWREQELYIT